MILLDTHAWLWYTTESAKLSQAVKIPRITKDGLIQNWGHIETIW
jgi:PIN domain nuclease of toxin-antitoxin system